MSEIKIRPAQKGDEEAIAKVHIQSWQEAYKDLIPKAYLDQLPEQLSERIDMWNRITANPKRWAYKKAYCWVLEKNPTIKFYEKTGAKYSGKTKSDDIGGIQFNELAFEWDSLNVGPSKGLAIKCFKDSL